MSNRRRTYVEREGKGLYYFLMNNSVIYYSYSPFGTYVEGAEVAISRGSFSPHPVGSNITNFTDKSGNIFILGQKNSDNDASGEYMYVWVIRKDVDITAKGTTINAELLYTLNATQSIRNSSAFSDVGVSSVIGMDIYYVSSDHNNFTIGNYISKTGDVYFGVIFSIRDSSNSKRYASILLRIDSNTTTVSEILVERNDTYRLGTYGPVIDLSDGSVLIPPAVTSKNTYSLDFTNMSDDRYYVIDPSGNVAKYSLRPDKSAEIAVGKTSYSEIGTSYNGYIVDDRIVYVFIYFNFKYGSGSFDYAVGTMIYKLSLDDVESQQPKLEYVTHTQNGRIIGGLGDNARVATPFNMYRNYVIVDSRSARYGLYDDNSYVYKLSTISENGLTDITEDITYTSENYDANKYWYAGNTKYIKDDGVYLNGASMYNIVNNELTHTYPTCELSNFAWNTIFYL